MKKINILVVGGAGFIGSHMINLLGKGGYDITTLDDFSGGYRDAVLYGDVIEGSCNDCVILRDVFRKKYDAVIHFASFIDVAESILCPNKYYRNNLLGTITLLDAIVEQGIDKFVFSSTAATFGEPQYIPIDECHPQNPINPYGRTKLMVEQILADYDKAYGLKSVCLRYFNAAGAHPEGLLGERHVPETHLIPLVLQAASGRRANIAVFGQDYDTPDGTCIRDYVHVEDLCAAHLLALEYLLNGADSQVFNLGNGNGFSVQEVITTAEKVTKCKIPTEYAPRRQGDPARLVADSEKAKQKLGWKPKYSDLATIIEHAWQWELNHFGTSK